MSTDPQVQVDGEVEVEGSPGFVNKAAEAVTGIPDWDAITEIPPMIHMTGDYGAAGGKLRLYLSGPMSGYVGHNYPVFHAAAKALRDRGFEVVSPAELGYEPGWDWLQYIIRDLESIKGCHGIVVLPRFYESAGAIIEVMAARRMKLALWKMEGAEYIGQLRPDESLDYESDDLELIGASVPTDVQELLDYVNAGETTWVATRDDERVGWTFAEQQTGRTIMLTEEFIEDNPINSANPSNLDKIGDFILREALVPA